MKIAQTLKKTGIISLEALVGGTLGWLVADTFIHSTPITGESALISGGYYEQMNNNAAGAIIGSIALPLIAYVIKKAYKP